MENISNITYETIRKLILKSEWGRSVTNKELFNFLFSEVYEFVEACNKKDKDNMLEEASDVMMILLYIVIKNVDSQQDNQIEELLYRINKKLQTRYSVFFKGDQDGEAEELNWIQAKHEEKEILNYLYCPIPSCCDYAKANKGNMLIKGDYVVCQSCGYTAKCSSNNMIMYASKYRRRLFDTFSNNYVGYLKGILFYADNYFNTFRQDYLKVLRYYISNRTGGAALKDYYVSRYNTSEESFDEFLMFPLRNCLKNLVDKQIKLTHSIIELNDLLLRCINVNYTGIRDKFCKTNDFGYCNIWREYIGFLMRTIVIPLEYDTDIVLPLNSYKLTAVIGRKRKTHILLKQLSEATGEQERVLQVDISACSSNVQVGQVIMSVVIKFNLQNTSKLQCVLLDNGKRLEHKELSKFIKDLFPMFDKIEYL